MSKTQLARGGAAEQSFEYQGPWRAAVRGGLAALALLLGAGDALGAAGAIGGAVAVQAQSDAGCDLSATHRLFANQIQLGEAVEGEVRVDVDCHSGELSRHFVVGVQAFPTASERNRVAEAVAAMVDAAPADTRFGLVLGGTFPPTLHAVGTPNEEIKAAVRAHPTGTGGATAADLIAEARVLQSDHLLPGREHIVLVTRAGAPRASESRLHFEIEVTMDQGMEITRLCVGGGCPAGLRWESNDVATPADLPPLLTEIAARPADSRLLWMALTQHLGGVVDYEWGSAAPAPSRLGSDATGDYIRWRVDDSKADFVARFRVRPFATGSVRVLQGLSVVGKDTAARDLVAEVSDPLTVEVTPAPVRPSACRMLGQADASPQPVTLGATLATTLTLAADCPPVPHDVDVILAFDRSRSMEGLPIGSIRRAAAAFIDGIQLERARVAVMTYGTEVDVRTGLTNDRGTLLAALEDIEFAGDTHLSKAIHAGREVLDDRRGGALPVMVFLSDGKVRDDPVDAADWARVAGIRIATVCFNFDRICEPKLRSVASSQYFFAVHDEAALMRTYAGLGEVLARPDVERLSVTQHVNDAFGLSAQPSRDAPTRSGDRLTWLRADPILGRTHLAYNLTADGLGSWPLARSIEAYWRDSAGGVGAAQIPIPVIDVVAPLPEGPCRTGGSARSVDPQAVGLNEDVDVTTRIQVACEPTEVPIDVVFAIDHSFSMGQLQRLNNARDAVNAFMDSVSEGDLWFGLVGFNERVTTEVPVGPDTATIAAALNGLTPDGGTDIGRAIDASSDLLAAGRDGARRVMVVLTDGANNPTGLPVLDAAGRAREAGVLLVAVCAGGECDPDLELAATSPAYYYDVDDEARMADLFERLAGSLIEAFPSTFWIHDQHTRAFAPVSARPPATPLTTTYGSRWILGVQPPAGWLLTQTLRAELPGRQPSSLWTRVDYGLTGGGSGSLYLASPPVDVQGPPPSGLPTMAVPPTPSPEPTYAPPTATPPTVTRYLPLAYNRGR